MRLGKVTWLCIIALVCGLSFEKDARGQTVTILNPSFESPALADGANQGVDAPLILSTTTGVVGNWTINMSTLVGVPLVVPARGQIENPVGSGPPGIDGAQMGRLTSSGLVGVATAGTFYQDLGVSFLANTRYTLVASVGLANLAQVPTAFGFSLMNGSNAAATTSQTALLSLLTNSNQLFQATLTFDTDNTPPPGNVGIQFFQTNLGGVAGSMIFDNVSLNAVAIPEPSTYALLGGTLLVAGAAAYRWKRRKAQEGEALVRTA